MRRPLLRLAALLALSLAALSVSAAVAAATLTEYPLPTQNRGPNGMTLGAEGDVWFAESSGPGAVGKITPSGEITEYTTGLTAGSQPDGIARGREGDLWFTEFAGPGRIGRITPSGTVTEYPTPTNNSQPTGIALGPEGDLWFTEAANPGRIGRITPSGVITEYPTPTANTAPAGIAQGPDGNMWFTEAGGSGAIGRITPAGVITEFTKGLTASSQPTGIAAGPEGNLWFTEAAGTARIGRITPAGTITEFSAGLTANSEPLGITAGADGAMYFTENKNPGRIGRITPAGTITETATPTANSQPEGIVTGGDGNIWYSAVGNHGQIGSLTVAPGVGTLAATSTERAAVLNALVSPNSQATFYDFEYGPTSEYGRHTTVVYAGDGAGLARVSAAIEGLQEGSTYHYRVVAANSSGTTYGADQTFSTTTPPAVATAAATGVGTSTATLHGTVDPPAAAADYWFEYGESASYGARSAVATLAAGGEQAVASSLISLLPGTVYHYRLVASNCEGCAGGTVYGDEMVFVTETTPLTTPLPNPVPAGPAAVKPPEIGTTALLKIVSGTVTVTAPGRAAIPLRGAADIPIGSTVDTRHGTLELSTAIDARGDAQTASVWGGVFTVGQERTGTGMTTLTVTRHPSCRRQHHRRAARAARSGATAETLWAHDNHGRFSTRGHNSVATVRGTWWSTTETCAGTLTTVRQGLVSVRPRHGRVVLVRAGHSYLARA